VPEIIGSLAGGELSGERSDTTAQARNCALARLAQIGLHLAEGHLDRVQVGGIFGQIAKRRAARFDGLADTGGLVRWKIVEHDDVITLEGLDETTLDVGQESHSGHCAIDCVRRRHAILAQSGYEGDCLPMALRHMVHQSLAASATAVQPHHLGIGRSFIDEHQPGRIKQALFAHPVAACPGYVRTLLLGRPQAFF